MTTSYNDFNSKYRCALDAWLSRMDKNAYRLIDSSDASTVRVEIKPVSARACPILIASHNGSTQVHLGKRIWFDEVDGLYADDRETLTTNFTENSFLAMLTAVWTGSVTERIEWRKGEVLKDYGEIRVRGKLYSRRSRYWKSWFLCPDQLEEVSYEHY